MAANAELDDALQLTRELADEEGSQRWLASPFHDPIVFSSGAPSVTNGQHRACAVRCSGAR